MFFFKNNIKIIFLGIAVASLAAIFLVLLNSKESFSVVDDFSRQEQGTQIAGVENEMVLPAENSDFTGNIQNGSGNKERVVAQPDPDLASKEEESASKPATNDKNNKEIEKDDLVNWGFHAGRSQKVDVIIIHSVYNSLGGERYDLEKILGIFKDYGVSPHYIIDRLGKIHQLVEEKNTAYHAGESQTPDGRSEVNGFSIGIELINAEDDKPESAQYQALEKLINQIKGRYKIKYILGHSDIAQGRKTDPWNFDWNQVGGKKK